jgi:hypothetical protein
MIGIENVLAAQIVYHAASTSTIELPGRTLVAESSQPVAKLGPVFVCIPAEAVQVLGAESNLEDSRSQRPNQWSGTLVGRVRDGHTTRMELDCGFPLVARVLSHSTGTQGLSIGDRVSIEIPSNALHVIPR